MKKFLMIIFLFFTSNFVWGVSYCYKLDEIKSIRLCGDNCPKNIMAPNTILFQISSDYARAYKGQAMIQNVLSLIKINESLSNKKRKYCFGPGQNFYLE